MLTKYAVGVKDKNIFLDYGMRFVNGNDKNFLKSAILFDEQKTIKKFLNRSANQINLSMQANRDNDNYSKLVIRQVNISFQVEDIETGLKDYNRRLRETKISAKFNRAVSIFLSSKRRNDFSGFFYGNIRDKKKFLDLGKTVRSFGVPGCKVIKSPYNEFCIALKDEGSATLFKLHYVDSLSKYITVEEAMRKIGF